MTYFAQINDSSIVINVIKVDDSDTPNEAAGIAFASRFLAQTRIGFKLVKLGI